MCGIAGIYAFIESGKSYFKNMPSALETLKLRGINNTAHQQINKACLGHTRLSIIDLSEHASQPMTDEQGRYTIIFNGEIYNFTELRNNLKNKGITFNSASDTEVLLKLYIQHKEECVHQLNGFFAFAVYDKAEDSLFIARDHIGIKPLLYFYDDDKLFFASEMKAMLQLGVPKNIDQQSLREYFRFNYIPSPNTIFQNVHKLDTGTYLTVKNGKVETKKYYSIPYKQSNYTSLNYEDSQAELRLLIEQSVRMRLVSDVPIGAFLSGGIDSSVLVSEAVKHTPHLNTFSIGYKDEPFFDETHYAELVAKKFKTNHRTFKLSHDELYANLHKVLDYIDEPFADSSALAVHILSMHTRQFATVSLSGDGADEMFSGYNKHQAHYLAMQNSLKSVIIKAGKPIWSAMPKSRNGKFSNLFRQLDKYAKGLSLNDKERYLHWASIMQTDKVNCLFNQSEQWGGRQDNIVSHFAKDKDINDVLFADMQLVLVSDMLHKVDSMSMANSLEVRTPFLDQNIVKFAFSLPQNYKINAGQKKRILQDAYRNILPQELYNRSKHGFEVPLLKWFRTELKSEIENKYLNPDFIASQGIFNPQEIVKIQEQLFSNNPQDVQATIWALVVFQHWWINVFK